MIERHFILDGIDPVGFYGAGNIHLQMLKKLHPKLRIVFNCVSIVFALV